MQTAPVLIYFFTTKPTKMNSEVIMKSDVLDILFEKRNKDYGAYTLRKFYNARLLKSMGIMMLAVIAFSAFTFLPDADNKQELYIIQDPGFGQVPPPAKPPEEKPKVEKPSIVKPVSSAKLLSKILIVDNKDSSDLLFDLKDLAIGSNTNIILEGGNPIIGGGGDSDDIAVNVKPAAPLINNIIPLENPEIMPSYPGGTEALRKFLERNLSNPRDLESGEMISVKIKAVVGYDGKLKNFELVQDGGNEFNNEVIRVLKKMPAWLPGKSKGQNVSVYYTIPVKFIGED